MKRIHTLTAAQQDFAEEHIGLVYRFLQEHRLPQTSITTLSSLAI